MKLTLQWNSILFARNIFNGEEYLNQHQQNHLLEIAIIENKPEFVELLIENGTNIENFLSYGRLYYFYNSKKVCHKDIWLRLKDLTYLFRKRFIWSLKERRFMI